MSCCLTEKGDKLREHGRADQRSLQLVARHFRRRRGQVLDGDAHQLGKRAHIKLGFKLRAGVGNGLVAHMQILGDHPVGFAFGDERSVCSSRTVMRRNGLVGP